LRLNGSFGRVAYWIAWPVSPAGWQVRKRRLRSRRAPAHYHRPV